ncbi:pre-toxin TG domain-containing protein [Shewanella sp. AC91-MNA-CIBAN-0169]|uniref:RHS repeat-associated core domain-containing protein n=1 Tax=Shewanella sp. AC91-MNA-CIBAN-0169 TaxID=3140466 RepID=UPI003326042E
MVSTTYYVGSFEREVTLSSTVDKTYIGDHTIKMKAHVGSLGNQSPFQHVLRDHLGSVDTLMDARTGAVLQHRGYDVFGRPRDIASGNTLLSGTNWQGVTKGYTNHEHLIDQELIHMNGRIYDFNIGRFLSVDPFLQFPENSQSANPYSYILNNPMSGTDPTGYCQAEDNMSDCSGSLKSGETKAITDADGKRVGTVGKDSNGTTYVTSGGKGDVKDAMAFTNNTGRFKSDVGKQNSIGIKDSGTNVNQDPSLGQQGLSLGLDVAPVVGGVKGGAQVFTGEDLITGEKLSRWEEAGYAVLGFFGAKGLAKAGDIADFGEASLKVLRQGDNLPDSVNFKGLVQNRNLQDLTHQDLTKAFDGTGFTLSNHAINRLKHSRTRDLGFGNLNDISKVFNKGARFDAGRGEIGFSYRGLEAIVNPKTNNIVTFRPEKLRR